jgi:hypothetical protein
LDNLGKDILTIVSGFVGVGDSAEVYAVKIMVNLEGSDLFLLQVTEL